MSASIEMKVFRDPQAEAKQKIYEDRLLQAAGDGDVGLVNGYRYAGGIPSNVWESAFKAAAVNKQTEVLNSLYGRVSIEFAKQVLSSVKSH